MCVCVCVRVYEYVPNTKHATLKFHILVSFMVFQVSNNTYGLQTTILQLFIYWTEP